MILIGYLAVTLRLAGGCVPALCTEPSELQLRGFSLSGKAITFPLPLPSMTARTFCPCSSS
jgi:hypothetical protein